MEKVQNNLDSAISFINNKQSNDTKSRDRLCELLTTDLLYLDSIKHENKKETIIAIQNILDQLDHLFDQKKIIILSNKNNINRNYLPDNRQSDYALGLS